MSPTPKLPQLQIENAMLLFPNFAGEPRPPYNAAGDRNFCVLIDPETAEQLKADGWNVRLSKSTDGSEPQPYISVNVKIDGRFPPRLFLINAAGSRPTQLDPSEYNILDYARFQRVDLTVNPYVWQEIPQRVTGYLQEGYFTLQPDKFRDRYLLTASDEPGA